MSEKIANGTIAAWQSASHKIVIPENLEHYLQVNTTAYKVRKTSRGWKPVDWKYLGNSRPFVPIGFIG